MEPNEPIDPKSRDGILRALAVATTEYFEASPDRIEIARVQYEQVLERFNRAQSEPAGIEDR